MDQSTVLRGDRPLKSEAKDWLGFDELAKEFAAILSDRTASDGIVLGLEGKWGSGKSSLVSRVIANLTLTEPKDAPIILSFQPWLIGNRDALISEFFNDLSKAVAAAFAMRGDTTRVTLQKSKDLVEQLRKYAGYAGSLAPLASMAALASVPGATAAEKFLKLIGKAKTETKLDAKPLFQIKSEIENAISDLGVPIVIFIDDVDRLEPIEISEILRLVRSVADFPLTTYVLCYDREVVSHAIQKAMHVKDGAAYIEKIFQLSVKVPTPEPFALRKMFQAGLSEFLVIDEPNDRSRVAQIIDNESEALNSPRAVNRALDALRFQYASLKGRVDLPDLIWLTLVRLSNSLLHDWIEQYVAAMAACTSGRVSIREEWKSKGYKQLKKSLGVNGSDIHRCLIELSQYLPGIDTGYIHQKDKVPIYQSFSDREIGRAIEGRRLASPDHYRLFFALGVPSGAPLETDYSAFIEAANISPDAVVELLASWMDRSDSPASKAEVILGRLADGFPTVFEDGRSENIVLAIADALDHPSIISQIDDFLGPPIWFSGRQILKRALPLLGVTGPKIIQTAFASGKAIGWLVDVLRTETFAHGLHGDRKRPEYDWVLDSVSFEHAVEAARKRFNDMSVSELLDTPSPINTLFAYSQIGEEQTVRDRLNEYSVEDDRFVSLLRHFLSAVNSTGGNYFRIDPDSLEILLGSSDQASRLEALSNRKGFPLADEAKRLLEAIGRSR